MTLPHHQKAKGQSLLMLWACFQLLSVHQFRPTAAKGAESSAVDTERVGWWEVTGRLPSTLGHKRHQCHWVSRQCQWHGGGLQLRLCLEPCEFNTIQRPCRCASISVSIQL